MRSLSRRVVGCILNRAGFLSVIAFVIDLSESSNLSTKSAQFKLPSGPHSGAGDFLSIIGPRGKGVKDFGESLNSASRSAHF